MATGIARVGREAGQRGGGGRCGGAEFGQFSAQAGSGERAAARNGANDLAAPPQTGTGVEAGLDRGVDLADLGREVVEQGLEQVGGRAGGRGGVLAQSSALLDELATQSEQVAQCLLIRGLGRGALEMVEAGVAGEHGRVDAVGLGLLAERAGEIAHALRVGEDDSDALVVEALMEFAVVAAGRFQGDPPGIELAEPVAEGLVALVRVGEAALARGWIDEDVEPSLADVDAGDRLGRRCRGRCHALIGILSSGQGDSREPLLFEMRARAPTSVQVLRELLRRAIQLPNGAKTPSYENDPTRRPLPGLARPGSGLPAMGRGDSCSASRQRRRPAETSKLHPAGCLPAGVDQGCSSQDSFASVHE